MTWGKIVAKRYKKQYCKRNKWTVYPSWNRQPEECHLILLELKTKKAIKALLNISWVQHLRKPSKRVRYA